MINNRAEAVMKVFLCGNTGCENHGCEAIVRSTVKLLNRHSGDFYLCSWREDQDAPVAKNIGINLLPYSNYPSSLARIILGGLSKLAGVYMYKEKLLQRPLFSRMDKDDVCLNIGGDTYCYGTPYPSFALNRHAQKVGCRSILWCHSIEDEVIADRKVKRDLLRYSQIFARDGITVENLRKNGIPNEKIVRVCDPAFFLEACKTELPKGFATGNTVGINISTGVIKDSHPVVYENVLRVSRFILDNTDMNICLIPHVYSVKHNRGDHLTMQRLLKDLKSERVSAIDKDVSCGELKYIISNCRFMIAARTHASIAAYSTCVPTIVLGYSVKSRGIAQDLFGTYKGYVLPYQKIEKDTELLDSFKAVMNNEASIRQRLHDVLPSYKRQLIDAINKYIPKQSFDKKTICDFDICSGCSSCAAGCPFGAITMQKDREGFLSPVIDSIKCRHCGKCISICPVLNKPKDDSKQPVAYAAQAHDDKLRKDSSSGGVFTLLAERIIEKGGVVYGCAYDDSITIQHIRCESKEELGRLRGSKYVQSNVRNTFLQARDDLDNGKIVYYSGTPCQVSGLLAFLGRQYDNLFTQDIICHGVPSPSLWEKYVSYRESQSGAKARRVSFRNKKNGWRSYFLQFDFYNGEQYNGNVRTEPWMNLFLSGLSCRRSCSLCSFRNIHRQSDVTLADFWGVRHVMQEWDDDKGTSLVLIHSDKGLQLWNQITDFAEVRLVNIMDVYRYSSPYIKSDAENPLRKAFVKDAQKMPIDQIIKKYTSNKIPAKIRRKLMKYIV